MRYKRILGEHWVSVSDVDSLLSAIIDQLKWPEVSEHDKQIVRLTAISLRESIVLPAATRKFVPDTEFIADVLSRL